MSTSPSASRRSGERGAVTVFAVVIVLALFLAVGLVVDGGSKIRAIQRAEAIAAEAARAGGQAVVFGRGAGGAPTIDTGAASQAAQSYLSTAGVQGTVRATAERITVEVTMTYDTIFFSLIGLGSDPVTGEATARLAYGVTGEL